MISVLDIPKGNFSFFSNKVLTDIDVAVYFKLGCSQQFNTRDICCSDNWNINKLLSDLWHLRFDLGILFFLPFTFSITDCDKEEIPGFPFLVIYSVFFPHLFHFIPFPSLDS